MNAHSGHGTPPNHSSPTETTDAAEMLDEAQAGGMVPEWAPPEPLPSAAMFLTAFSGTPPVTAADILHPANDLVKCVRDYRLAFGVLADREASPAELRPAGTTLTTAETDIAMLTLTIDDAVLTRMAQRRKSSGAEVIEAPTSVDPTPAVPRHTESIGQIAAKMAALWERTSNMGANPLAAATHDPHDLDSLCADYDGLAAEIESGRRVLPWM